MTNWRNNRFIAFVLVLCVLHTGRLDAAEVRGTVDVDYQGLFRHGEVPASYPVSVALMPAAGQSVAARTVDRRTVEIVGNRMQPAFLTVRAGDSVVFVNRDDVYHEVFSLSPGKPVKARLGKAGDKVSDHAVFAMDQVGTVHFFCRIHNKSYARIDVVETPYFQVVEPGGEFAFTGLQAGRWRLRLAAPAAETEWYDVTAVTSPPPLHMTLMSRGGQGTVHRSISANDTVDRLYGRSGAENAR